MDSGVIPMNDADLRTRILAGLAAAADLERRVRKPLERFLVGMCDRSDGRSQEQAVEIASQIIADCFVKSPSLLERWRGDDNLEAFLRTAGANDLRSYWKSAGYIRTNVSLDTPGMENAAFAETEPEAGDADLAYNALLSGAGEAEKSCPEGLVFMRLKGLFRVEQRVISQCWGQHESQTSRRIKEAMAIFRDAAREYARERGCELTPELLQQALHRHPAVLLGEATAGEAGGEEELLRRVASGEVSVDERRTAVAKMCRDAQALAYFACLLNRRMAGDLVIVKTPAMTGMGAQLQTCLRRSLELLRPAEARGLIDATLLAAFAGILAQVRADGGTLWLLCPGETALEAVFNPMEPEIAGKRQPLRSGIVSLVLATGEAVCAGTLAADRRHSPAIDVALGKDTLSMIAVPFAPGGTIRGVVTAVRLNRTEAFGDQETEIVNCHANVMARLFVQNLTAGILEE